jgi:hypothetical protein
LHTFQVALRSITERTPPVSSKELPADAPAAGAAPAFAAVALKSAAHDPVWRTTEEKPDKAPAYANLALKKTGVQGSPGASSAAAAAAGAKADGGAPAFANVALKSTGASTGASVAAAPTAATSLPASYNASAVHPYEVLKASAPNDIDPANKERHLSPSDFSKVFGMDLAAFNALPKWKRDAKKKEFGLF